MDFFESDISGSSVTQKGRMGEMEWDEKMIHVVDTPGIFDTETTEEKVISEIIRGCSMISPGPHIFLYVLTTRNRFTNEEKRAVDELINLFEDDAYKYMIICFTEKDALDRKGKTTDEYLRDVPESLRNIIQKCGNRTVFFDNVCKEKKCQWIQLYSVITKLLKSNGESYYSNVILKAVNRALKQKIKEQNDPVKEQRLFYELKRLIENDISTLNYVKRVVMGSTAGGLVAGLGTFLALLIAGKEIAVVIAVSHIASVTGGIVGGALSLFT